MLVNLCISLHQCLWDQMGFACREALTRRWGSIQGWQYWLWWLGQCWSLLWETTCYMFMPRSICHQGRRSQFQRRSLRERGWNLVWHLQETNRDPWQLLCMYAWPPPPEWESKDCKVLLHDFCRNKNFLQCFSLGCSWTRIACCLVREQSLCYFESFGFSSCTLLVWHSFEHLW